MGKKANSLAYLLCKSINEQNGIICEHPGKKI
jgi:hypothetical protein